MGIGDVVYDLTHNWSVTSAALVIVIPWTIVLGLLLYYYLFKRPKQYTEKDLAPFFYFFAALTSGATAGFDQQLMRLFHPALLQRGADGKGGVSRGVLRAMARCLRDRFGPIVTMSDEVVLQKQRGLQVNCEALVDFEKAKGVRCQLGWVVRLPSVAKSAAVNDAALRQRVEAGPPLFHVTSFHISPAERDVFDVLPYLDLEDFEPFVEDFVLHLILCNPLSAAVAVMHEQLQAKYTGEAARQELEQKMRRASLVCGGLRDPDGDATLKEKRIVRKPKAATEAEKEAQVKTSDVEAIEMVYVLEGRTRNLEVEVRVIFAGLQCYVIRYDVRMQADTRTQVVLDGESGESTVVA